MAEISTNQPGAPLLHACGLRSPGHEFIGLRIGSVSNKFKEKKIHLCQPHSFGHYKEKIKLFINCGKCKKHFYFVSSLPFLLQGWRNKSSGYAAVAG